MFKILLFSPVWNQLTMITMISVHSCVVLRLGVHGVRTLFCLSTCSSHPRPHTSFACGRRSVKPAFLRDHPYFCPWTQSLRPFLFVCLSTPLFSATTFHKRHRPALHFCFVDQTRARENGWNLKRFLSQECRV